MSAITLTAAVRSNLLALQDTTANQATTQQRLATGKKVNSALDNPTNYFTAAALSARAGQLTNLLDSMTNGINTIKAASNGLDSITTTLQSMQATVTQARQDASWQSASYTYDASRTPVASQNLTFSNGAVTGSVSVGINTSAATGGTFGTTVTGHTFTVSDGTTATGDITLGAADSIATVVGKINTATGTAGNHITAAAVGNTIQLTSSTGAVITMGAGSGTSGLAEVGFSAGAQTMAYTAKTLDQIVSDVNATATLAGKVKASNNAGSLQITNLSTSALTVAGVTSTAVTGTAGNTQTIAANSTRVNLVAQFNQLKDQLDKTAQDASFNGINLLNGDQLKLYFNENSTSSITIQSTNTSGISASTLGVTAGTAAEFQSNTSLDTRLSSLQTAVTTVASQASAFGNNLSIVQNRQTFTNNMINTLQTGADGLTLADGNLEGANMLALQTRQQLSVQALSLASQANQAVLRLFG